MLQFFIRKEDKELRSVFESEFWIPFEIQRRAEIYCLLLTLYLIVQIANTAFSDSIMVSIPACQMAPQRSSQNAGDLGSIPSQRA